MTRWGSYQREVRIDGDKRPIQIQRLRCGQCGVTHALLPDFLHPYRRYLLSLMQEVLTFYRFGYACYKPAGKSGVWARTGGDVVAFSAALNDAGVGGLPSATLLRNSLGCRSQTSSKIKHSYRVSLLSGGSSGLSGGSCAFSSVKHLISGKLPPLPFHQKGGKSTSPGLFAYGV